MSMGGITMAARQQEQTRAERLAYWINSRWRKLDFRWNRTYGGLWHALFGVDGYAPATYFLLFPILLTVINGPTYSKIPSTNTFLLIAVVFAIAFIGNRIFTTPFRIGRSDRFHFQFGLLESRRPWFSPRARLSTNVPIRNRVNGNPGCTGAHTSLWRHRSSV